jgi:hypothetical protein
MGHLDKGSAFTWGMSGQDIFVNFTEAGASAAGLNDAVQRVLRVSQGQYADVEDLRSLAVKLESAWQGAAADAANRGLTPFAIDSESSADALGQVSSLLSDQSGAFSSAKGGVVPVPPMPDKPPVLELLGNPAAVTSYQQQAAASDAASKHNVVVMQNYEAAADRNTSYLPTAYGAMAPDGAAVVVEPAPPSGAGVRTRHSSPPVPGPRQSMPSMPSTPVAASPASAPAVPATTGQPPVPSDMSAAPGSTTVSQRQPGGRPDQPSVPVVSDPVAPRGAGGIPAPVAGGASPIAGRGASASWSRPVPGGEPVPGRPGTAEPGRDGARSTAMAEDVTSRGGARGTTIGGLPIGAGGGRGRGADEARQRSAFLLEPETDDLFGTDEVTAPSVIE